MESENKNLVSMHERKKIAKPKMIALCLFLIALAVFFDQYTKYLAVSNLKDQNAYVLIDKVLELYYIVNIGSSWGMLAGQKALILFISAVIVALCIFMIFKSPEDVKFIPFNISLSMIIAGGIGNGIDRIRYSYVIDFIYFKAINFPVFNVADIFVSLAFLSFLFLLVFVYNEDEFNKCFGNFKKKEAVKETAEAKEETKEETKEEPAAETESAEETEATQEEPS